MLTDKRKREIFEEIDEALLKGVKQQELFTKYSPEFTDREPLALHLTLFINPTIRQQYELLEKSYTVVLIIFSTLTIIYFSPSLIVLLAGLWGYKLILYPFLGGLYTAIPSVPCIALYLHRKYSSFSFRIIKSSWFIIFALKEDLFFSNHALAIGVLLKVLIVFTCLGAVFLAYRLEKAFFPNRSKLFGSPIEKDKSGNYIFNDL